MFGMALPAGGTGDRWRKGNGTAMLFEHVTRAIQKILIVEDEPLVAFENEHTLAHAGYEIVDTVDSCAHAELVIKSASVDLVLADIRLTGKRSGVEVAQIAHDQGVPVLFVTGRFPSEARHLGLGCLSKPYGQRDLLTAIEAVDAVMRGEKPARIPRTLQLF